MEDRRSEVPMILKESEKRTGQIFETVLGFAVEQGLGDIVRNFLRKEAKRYDEIISPKPQTHSSQTASRQLVAKFASSNLDKIDWAKFNELPDLKTEEGQVLYGLQIGFVEYIINSEAAYVLNLRSNLSQEVVQVYRDEWERGTKEHFVSRLAVPWSLKEALEIARVKNSADYLTSSLPDTYITDRGFDSGQPPGQEELLFYQAFRMKKFPPNWALPALTRTSASWVGRIRRTEKRVPGLDE